MEEINLFTWEEYTPKKGGLIFSYTSALSSELPIRDVLGENNKGMLKDPNYETQTFGYFDCLNLKERIYFVENKLKYAFFLTKYVGLDEEYSKKLLITGYMEVSHIKNMYGRIDSCFDKKTSHKLKAWWAFYGKMKFVSLQDSYEITEEDLEKWGVNNKTLRQQTIILPPGEEENLKKYFDSKENIIDAYIEEVKKFDSFNLDI